MTIHKIDTKKSDEITPSEKKIISYTMFGAHNALDKDGYPVIYNNDAKEVYAQKIIDRNKETYYIKRSGDGRFYNPLGMYESDYVTTRYKYVGQAKWRLRQVTIKVFSYYLAFLTTRNKAWLINAEREAV